ncbi:MAG: hypothetical protein C0404_08630 [Verrucomicrobia bacterium]|nr:hypothetical protein [Verrucomicrobiota bacterium]
MSNEAKMPGFSVIIPTWKNVEYLDLAYRGLTRNSAVEHEVIVFFNEMDDDCRRWLEGKNVVIDWSEQNLGVCAAVNRAAKLASTGYICYMNDDMYPLPGWDTALWQYINAARCVWIAGTAVEAGRATACYIGGHDYGQTPADFKEDKLLAEFGQIKRMYNVVSTWTPMLVKKSDWDAVGGFDEKYFPGYGSDPDLAMKLYLHGCRHFIGVGTSLVYHFSRRTISRFDSSYLMDPKEYFRKKWGITWKKFFNDVIHRDKIITDDLMEKVTDDSRWTASRVLKANRKQDGV